MNFILNFWQGILIAFFLGMLLGSLLTLFYVISRKRYYVNFKTDAVPAFIDIEKASGKHE